MAVYFNNTLVRTVDFLKFTDRYSSVQSIWRAKKRGMLALTQVGGLQFAPATAEQVSQIYSVRDWHGLAVVEHLPAGLEVLGKVKLAVGVGEGIILEWALFNRLDVYWVGGSFFTHTDKAKQVAALSANR